jgi:adenylate cyclase, class 2
MRNRETEVKIRIADRRALRQRLKELGFRPTHPKALEDNVLFDTADRALRRVRAVLRVRRYGSQWIVTYKGTPQDDPHYKSRLELESEVSNPESIQAIFRALGMVPVFRYQKYRTHFALPAKKIRKKPAFEVALDETPIGDFMELEGSRSAIDRVARQLGYTRSDYNTASYGALYVEDCASRNVTPTDMIFERGARRDRQPEKAAPRLRSAGRT